ncbi:MAG: RNase P subunit p30 family protein [Candidatus Diapherotrites archaeon]
MNIDLVFYEDLKALEEASEFTETDTYIIAKNFKSKEEISKLREKIKSEKSKLSFKICHIIEKPNANDLKVFQNADFIAVRGGTPETNGFAAAQKKVDFLIQPCTTDKFAFDTGVARLLGERNTAVIFPFSQFLNAFPKERAMLFKNYIFATKIMKKFKVNALFFSAANNTNELRCVQNFSAFATLFGFTELQGVRFTTTLPEKIIQVKE